jgi:hypothetical protein
MPNATTEHTTAAAIDAVFWFTPAESSFFKFTLGNVGVGVCWSEGRVGVKNDHELVVVIVLLSLDELELEGFKTTISGFVEGGLIIPDPGRSPGFSVLGAGFPGPLWEGGVPGLDTGGGAGVESSAGGNKDAGGGLRGELRKIGFDEGGSPDTGGEVEPGVDGGFKITPGGGGNEGLFQGDGFGEEGVPPLPGEDGGVPESGAPEGCGKRGGSGELGIGLQSTGSGWSEMEGVITITAGEGGLAEGLGERETSDPG